MAVWAEHMALFGVAVKMVTVMVVYLHQSLDKGLASEHSFTEADIHEAAIARGNGRL